MERLVKPCENCHKPMNGGVYRASHICPHCLHEHAGGKKARRPVSAVAKMPPPSYQTHVPLPEVEEMEEEQYGVEEIVAEETPITLQLSDVVLSTKSIEDYDLTEVLDELNAECALSIKLTPDLFENGKFLGARSEKVKAAMEQGKKHTLAQLRKKAFTQQANLVANITVKNTIKSADGQKANILVKASGISAKMLPISEALATA